MSTIVVNFSGGKDSSALLAHIMDDYANHDIRVVMADTGFEHVDAIDWSKSIVDRYNLPLHVVRNPNKTFLSMVKNRGKFPGMSTRQCTSDLKRGPVQTWIRRNCESDLIFSAMGLRAEESTARAKRPRMARIKSMCNSRRTVWEWNPIHHWSENRVRAFLLEKDIPLHPVYKYLNRFSCRVCLFHTKADTLAVAKNDPGAIEIISRLEDIIGHTIFMDGPIKNRI